MSEVTFVESPDTAFMTHYTPAKGESNNSVPIKQRLTLI